MARMITLTFVLVYFACQGETIQCYDCVSKVNETCNTGVCEGASCQRSTCPFPKPDGNITVKSCSNTTFPTQCVNLPKYSWYVCTCSTDWCNKDTIPKDTTANPKTSTLKSSTPVSTTRTTTAGGNVTLIKCYNCTSEVNGTCDTGECDGASCAHTICPSPGVGGNITTKSCSTEKRSNFTTCEKNSASCYTCNYCHENWCNKSPSKSNRIVAGGSIPTVIAVMIAIILPLF